MTNDERKLLEDRIHDYGAKMRDERWGENEKAWGRVMDSISKIQKRSERDEQAKNYRRS